MKRVLIAVALVAAGSATPAITNAGDAKPAVYYIVETFNNAHVRHIHVSRKVVNEANVTHVDIEVAIKRGTAPKLWRRLAAVPGVTEVWLKEYSVDVTKGEAFDWDVVFPQVLEVLKEELAGGAEFLPKPKGKSEGAGATF
jgi:hypothetical protein